MKPKRKVTKQILQLASLVALSGMTFGSLGSEKEPEKPKEITEADRKRLAKAEAKRERKRKLRLQQGGEK